MVPALELLELSHRDAQAAENAYFEILMRKQYTTLGEELTHNGLGDVFSDDTIAKIAEILKAYLDDWWQREAPDKQLIQEPEKDQ